MPEAIVYWIEIDGFSNPTLVTVQELKVTMIGSLTD